MSNQRILQVWYAADVAEPMHPIRDEEEVRGLPRLQIHYQHDEYVYPLDLIVELVAHDNQERRITWRITKNWGDWGDWLHLFLEPHPI